MAEPDPSLAPLLAMVELLPGSAVEELGRALHAKLTAPPTAAERRVKTLRFLTGLLGEEPQYPERLPYIPRGTYDARRSQEPSAGPPSARLVEKFGSWARACHAAWGLLDDGRSWGQAQPWPRHPRRCKNYTLEEAVSSLRLCADRIGHIPSSTEYHRWVLARRVHARQTGEDVRPYAPQASVLRLLAPDRSAGNGWRLVINRTFHHAPDDCRLGQ
jgi:hypothetical protein